MRKLVLIEDIYRFRLMNTAILERLDHLAV